MPEVIASNDRARYDYEILETFEAGIVLSGQEVKAAKFGLMKLKGAHVVFRGKEAYLLNAHVARYPKAGPLPDYDPERSRKLLLHNKELTKLRGKLETKGLTIVPLRAFIKGGRIKIDIGLARGKREYEKRETIKKRDLDRELRGHLKRNRI
jgi:SsrA-binding protein